MPLGSDVVVMARAALTVMLKLPVAVALVESVTLAVKLNVPDAVGVPEIWPEALSGFIPVGREPTEMLQV